MDRHKVNRVRESAFSMDIHDDEDPSPIRRFIIIGEKLHILKDRSLHKVIMADDIDPARTDISIPNAHQKVFSFGNEDEFVGKVLLTAQKLFDKNVLDSSIDTDEALSTAMQTTRSIAAMFRISDQFEEAQKNTVEKAKGTAAIPSVPEMADMVKAFLQQADHTRDSLVRLTKLFYGDLAVKKKEATQLNGLLQQTKELYGSNDLFCKFLEEALLPFLLFIRNARNCIEHPRNGHKIILQNFRPEGKTVYLPELEVVHNETPQPAITVQGFMLQIANHFADIAEGLMAHMCSKYATSYSGFDLLVASFPENRRTHKHVQFSYAMRMGDQLVPFG